MVNLPYAYGRLYVGHGAALSMYGKSSLCSWQVDLYAGHGAELSTRQVRPEGMGRG